MSHIKLLEHILDLLANGQTERADELSHHLIVEKSRSIYEDLINDEDDQDEEGSETDEFVDDVTDGKDDIETDELADGEADEFNFDGEEAEAEEETVEERLESLEDQLAALQAEFDERDGTGEDEFAGDDEFVGDEFADGEDEFADEEFSDELHEATQFLKDVPDAGMSKEGKFAGTGAKSKAGTTNTKSPFSKEVTKRLPTQDVVDFTKGSSTEGSKPTSSKESAADNLNTPTKSVSQDQKGDGKLAGTGKNTPKSAINTKSPFTKAPK